ncbi:hypothetical protein SKAU_G00372300 [Synaphobranchus kaupii]|uniref:Uncharacterized protein n=1 Tax=Synaphobranchus kaupii TaxID=118154 RepID=A0A9Q1IG20_SYNKA|nr:hypothetical protein SKAU_G00372300 [Synaphobranchus kaupii]
MLHVLCFSRLSAGTIGFPRHTFRCSASQSVSVLLFTVRYIGCVSTCVRCATPDLVAAEGHSVPLGANQTSADCVRDKPQTPRAGGRGRPPSSQLFSSSSSPRGQDADADEQLVNHHYRSHCYSFNYRCSRYATAVPICK